MRPGFAADLARRVLTGLVVLPLVLAGLLLGPPLLGVGIVAVALVIGLFEFFALLRARQVVPFRTAGTILLAVIFAQVLTRPDWPGPSGWPMSALIVLTALLLRRGEFAATVPGAAATFLGATYLGALGGAIAALRLLPPLESAPARLALLFAIVMVSDTMAYFVGSAFGRVRLAPAISPGKTVEGVAGGLVGGVLGALALRALALPALPLGHAVFLGAMVSALGTAGDLLESLFKRWAGVKDSGTLFPGHGGMLDRLDSLLFGAPVLYYYFSFVR